MRVRRAIGAGAALAGAAYAARQLAHTAIRRHEDLDPDTVERPGSMAFIDGVGFHLVERGRGPALLLIHGFGGGLFNFRDVIGPLSEHFRVVAVELPGFGYADRPTDTDLSHTARAERLAVLMERLDMRTATVLGHSMGGAIAMRLTAAHPDRVERLVLVGGAPPDERFVLPLYPLVRPLLPIAAALILQNLGIARRSVRKVVYDPAFVTDERWAEYTLPTRLRGFTASLLRMLDDVRHDEPLDPARVRQRTLLLWGQADTAVPLSVAHRLHATMPNARLEVVPRAGHLVLEEQPEAALEILLRFLREEAVGQGEAAS